MLGVTSTALDLLKIKDQYPDYPDIAMVLWLCQGREKFFIFVFWWGLTIKLTQDRLTGEKKLI